MHTREAPDFLGLHKNMNCAFPLTDNSLEACVFYSEPLIYMIQVLCFYKFTNSFYKVRIESQMSHQFTSNHIKIQNTE